MNSSNFITGILLGAVTGLAVGILLAPDKGTETRKKLAEKGKDLANSVKDKFNKAVKEGEAAVNETRNKVEEWDRKEDWKDKASSTFS